MPLLFKGEEVKKITLVADGKKKLVATARQYKNKLEGRYEPIGDDRVEVKEYWVTDDGKKVLKATASLNFDDMLIDHTTKPPKPYKRAKP